MSTPTRLKTVVRPMASSRLSLVNWHPALAATSASPLQSMTLLALMMPLPDCDERDENEEHEERSED